MFEHKSEPLLSSRKFTHRMLRTFGLASAIIGVALFIGILGYHITENMNWLDAILNASMILSGMGPANTISTDAGKLFASAYALFSGIVFISSAGLLITPVFHRVMHSIHVDDDEV